MCNTRIDEIAFQLVSDPWFDRVILATITVNGVFLALYDPTKESAEQVRANMPQQHIPGFSYFTFHRVILFLSSHLSVFLGLCVYSLSYPGRQPRTAYRYVYE